MSEPQPAPETPFDAVLLVAFGGPTAPDEIRPFLANVTRGRPIPPARLEIVAQHYEHIGGRSPLNELTFRQAQALGHALRAHGPELPVFVGMRNWHPFLIDVLRSMARQGVRRALAVILSTFESEAGWQRYAADVETARAALVAANDPVPEVRLAAPWGERPGFVDAAACLVAQALARIPAARRLQAELLFTAHSIPTAMAGRDTYERQFRRAGDAIAARCGHPRHRFAYQSRTGRPQDPWLEPDVNAALEQLERDGVRDCVVAPIGFVCDHVEVLYDLDVEARATAERCGIELLRAPAVNDHAAFIAMLADVVRDASRDAG